jgi:four helix bundle protein
MESWNNGVNVEIVRKNINRGFTQLNVWNDSILIFKMVFEMTKDFPYSLSKSRSNILDSAHSISRNIAEGYCRRNLKEYLNFLNISLGSVGELFSGIISFREAGMISNEEFERFDSLHYKMENELINLIKSLQKKQKTESWEDSFSA